MSRKMTLPASAIIILSLILSQTMLSEKGIFVSAEPEKLQLNISPPSVLADNNNYDAIIVQLQDASGKPARATSDVQISLSSSLINVGTVEPSVTVKKGSTYATSVFHSTFTPGTTTITATSTGYATVQKTITTIGPIPSAIAIYAFPPKLPADGNAYDAIIVQLQDTTGSPARAPLEGIQITLTSSETNVGTVDPTVTILAGKTHATAKFTTAAPGTATITAVVSGYTSKQTTITTQTVATNPTALKLYMAPPKVLADKSTYQQITVQLQDPSGNIASSTVNTVVTMASSDLKIGNVQSQVTIPTLQPFITTTFATEYKAGTTTIIAAATDLITDQEPITTIGPIPSKLAVYCSPATLPADNGTYNIVQVQLQDSTGKPAKDPETSVTVSLFSSEPNAGTVDTTLTIPFGATQATGSFKATNAQSSTTITAQASGYTPGQGTIRTYFIDFSPLTVAVTASPQIVLTGKQAKITAFITYIDGNPASGVATTFTSNNGGTFSTTKDLGNGSYTVTFTAPNFAKTTNCTITVIASKTGYLTSQGTTQLTVATTADSGTLQIQVKDDTGNPVDNALVTSISQPQGMRTLAGTTNQTGYVNFTNALPGQYTMRIVKTGCTTVNQTINFAGNSTAITLFISKDPATATSDSTLIIIIAVVLAVAIVAVTIVAVKVKRRNAEKHKLPPEYRKKRYNPPPMSPDESTT